MRDELILIGMYITTFGLGYVLGLLRHNGAIHDTRPPSFLKTAAKDNQAVTHVGIDDRKYVAPINTAGLTRGDATNSIGKTTATKDDIQGSVSKLAQLKGK
jgi:hypothetical protein